MTKRVIIATLSGLLFGFVCYGLASSGDYELHWAIAAQIIASRTLMGFAIGVSRLKLGHWAVHGIIFGLLFSLPMALSGLMTEVPDFTPAMMFISTVGIGAVYGLLTEVITSAIFKAKLKA